MKSTSSLTAMSERTPLWWPGGKTRGKRMMLSFIPRDERTICSPFIGGGSVELGLAARGARVSGYDIDVDLVNFWQQLLAYPDRLADLLEPFARRFLNRDGWRKLGDAYEGERSPLRRAAIFWLRNRFSYAGGSIGGSQSYFAKNRHLLAVPGRIEAIRNFRSPNLLVHRGDFAESIARHPDDFLVCDPPYPELDEVNSMYGASFDQADHERFASILNGRDRWLLVVNDVDFNHELYADRRRYGVTWTYVMTAGERTKPGFILLIVSDDVEVPEWAEGLRKERVEA